MKLNYFSEQTLEKKMDRSRAAKICFRKAGVISLNPNACEIIGIKPGDKISMAQDQENPKDWYVFRDSGHGFPARKAYNNDGVIFNHKTLVRKFCEANSLKLDKSYQFLIAGQKTTWGKVDYFGILLP